MVDCYQMENNNQSNLTKSSIGELFILGFHGKTIPDWLKKFAANYGLGGVILFDYYCQTKKYENNIYSPKQVKDLCAEIAKLPSKPMVFIDQEGGLVRRLKEGKGFKPLPSQQEINLLNESEKQKILSASFCELKDLGINFNFAPVIDINYNPQNPSIGAIKRSYSDNIEDVRNNTILAAEIARGAGICLCLKHYPGIGGADVDSHNDFMDISDSLYTEQEELFYELAPEIPGDAIIISHAIIKQWDADIPMTLSANSLCRIRDRLPHTLLISDDMQMQGLQKARGTKKAVSEALKAGLDMVCIGNNLLNEENIMLDIADYVDKLGIESVKTSIERVRERKKLFA